MTGFALGVSTIICVLAYGAAQPVATSRTVDAGFVPSCLAYFGGSFLFWWGPGFYLVRTTGLKFGSCKTYPVGCKI